MRPNTSPLPTSIQSCQSESELKIQSRRLSPNMVNDRDTIEAVSCDCSVSTLGEDNSAGPLSLPQEDSPVTSKHRWRNISGSDLEDMDLPPIGPRRSTACLEEDTSATNSSRQRSIHSTVAVPADYEPSEATDIHDDLSIQATRTAVEEFIQDLRAGSKQGFQRRRRDSFDSIPKPVVRTDSNNLENMATKPALPSATKSATFQRTFELPIRSDSEKSIHSIRHLQRTFSTGSREALNSSKGSLDTPPSIARRQSSNHSRTDLSTEEDCESHYDYDDDGSYAIGLKSPRIPSDQPPELAKRLASPSPIDVDYEVSFDTSAIELLDIEDDPSPEY